MIGALEHAATEDDFDRTVIQIQSADDGGDHGHHLVGQDAGGTDGHPVAGSGGVEAHPGQFEQAAVLEGAGIDGTEHRFRVAQAEMGRHEMAQGGGVAAAVPSSQGQPERPHPEPRTTGGEVAGQFGQGGESFDRAVGSAAHAVETRTTDHGHAPSRSSPGPEHGQGVVVEELAGAPSPCPDGAGEALLVHGQVQAGHAVHAGGRSRVGPRVEAGIGQSGLDGGSEGQHGTVEPGELVVGSAALGAAPNRAVAVEDPYIGLGGTAVYGQNQRTVGRYGWRSPAQPALTLGSTRRCYVPWVGTKVAVVGGGSTYTPELVDSLCAHEDRLVVDELVLLDPDAERLDAVGGLADRILRGRGWSGTLVTTDQRDRAIDGADFVIVQLRVGGQAARHTDETLPIGYGCLGQETTGPGGLAKALRTVPLVLDIAEETANRAAPGAWLVDFTNPVGIVTQALVDEGHRAVGLCNVAIHVQRRIGHYLGVDPDTVELEHVGLNHLTWVRSATVGGVDRLPELFDRFAPELELESGVPAGLLRLLGALPSYYLHYYYCLDQNVAEQSAPGWRSRAEVVAELEAELLAEYRDPTLTTKPKKLSYRGGAFYSEAAVRLVASLHADTGDTQVVDVRNDGAVPGLPDDAVVEVPCTVGRHGAQPLPQRALPPDMSGLVAHGKAYERLAVEAALSGSRAAMIRALVVNPLVGQYPKAEQLADTLLAANRQYLPRFFPEG